MIKEFQCRVPFEFAVDYPVMETQKLFQRADIFAGAEKSAGWSNTCAEAMASGLPAVATKAGTRDFPCDNVTGIVVPRHWWFLARGIRKILDSPELAKRLANAGQEHIRRFSWESLADDILLFIGQKISEAKAGGKR